MQMSVKNALIFRYITLPITSMKNITLHITLHYMVKCNALTFPHVCLPTFYLLPSPTSLSVACLKTTCTT